jgi:hypothetical protein
MKLLRLFVVLSGIVVFLEAGLVLKAFSAKHHAMQMLQTADKFRLGVTSKDQAETEFARVGLKTEDEGCSASAGTCQGFSVQLSNYPRFSSDSFNEFVYLTVAHLSLFRTAGIAGNFYFYSDHLKWMQVDFGAERSDVGVTLISTGLGDEKGSALRHDYHTGSDTFVRVLDPSQWQGVSLNSSTLLNLNCLASVRGCNSNGALWTAIPKP